MEQRILAYYRQYHLERFIGPAWVDQFTIRRFEKGESLCEIERPIDNLHFFVEGRARVFLPVESGRQLLLCFYEPLQLFGDLEIFEPDPLATTTVEAVTPCLCLSLRREFVINHLATDPVFLRQLSLSLARKLGRVIRNSTLNLLHPLESRVASYILATATATGDGSLVFSGNLSQIADFLGTSFRHLHRTLQTFCQQGILVKTKTTYTIRQLDELKRRAAGVYVMT